MIQNDLNSVLIEGKIIEIHENDFIIQTFLNKGKNSVQSENRFQIVTPYGRKYPIVKDLKVRVIGKLRCQEGDIRITIIPDHVEINRKKQE